MAVDHFQGLAAIAGLGHDMDALDARQAVFQATAGQRLVIDDQTIQGFMIGSVHGVCKPQLSGH